MTMFMVLGHHDKSHCDSSPGSSDECRLSAGWPPTLRPSQSTWAVICSISSYGHRAAGAGAQQQMRVASW